MASFYREGSTISFDGYKGVIVQITETYRKNVLVLKVSEQPVDRYRLRPVERIGIFEYPDGRLEFMSVIE